MSKISTDDDLLAKALCPIIKIRFLSVCLSAQVCVCEHFGYRVDGTGVACASMHSLTLAVVWFSSGGWCCCVGLSFHLHNGRTTNAFCIKSGDLMVARVVRARKKHYVSGGTRRGGFDRKRIKVSVFGSGVRGLCERNVRRQRSLHSHDICSQFN